MFFGIVHQRAGSLGPCIPEDRVLYLQQRCAISCKPDKAVSEVSPASPRLLESKPQTVKGFVESDWSDPFRVEGRLISLLLYWVGTGWLGQEVQVMGLVRSSEDVMKHLSHPLRSDAST